MKYLKSFLLFSSIKDSELLVFDTLIEKKNISAKKYSHKTLICSIYLLN